MNQPIRALHQIEMTSRCNLKCKYCVHPNMVRAKEDMSEETFLKALSVAKHFVEQGTQHELNLAGIGESTLHPNFVEWVHLARAAVGWNCHLVLSTNGVGFTDEAIEGIADTGLLVWVSPHVPIRAANAIAKLQEVGLFQGTSDGAWTSAVDWAGQVKLPWPANAHTTGTECPWIPNGRATVFSDGRISTCCFDSDGSGVVGHLEQMIVGKELFVKPYRLCGPCHHIITEQETLNLNLKEAMA